MESKKLAVLCREFAEDKKAEDVVVIDVSKLSSVTDFFVICSGTSEPHLRAISSEIEDRLRDTHQVSPRAIDGDVRSPWQALDYFDVIVHVMRPETRAKYDLEGLWGDAPRVKVRQKAAKAARAPMALKVPKARKAPKAPKGLKPPKK
jgi:ribosome-associated protein